MSNERLELRPEVRAFAEAMERELRANDHKPGWGDDNPEDLFERVKGELTEFQEVFQRWVALENLKPDGTKDWVDRTIAARKGIEACLLEEAADVANMLMMVVDRCGALDWSPEKAKDGRFEYEFVSGKVKGSPKAMNALAAWFGGVIKNLGLDPGPGFAKKIEEAAETIVNQAEKKGLLDRDKDWWLKRAEREGDSPISAGTLEGQQLIECRCVDYFGVPHHKCPACRGAGKIHPLPKVDIDRLMELEAGMTAAPWRISMSGYSVKSQDPDVPIVTAVHGGASATNKQLTAWLKNADALVEVRNHLRQLLVVFKAVQVWLHATRDKDIELKNTLKSVGIR